MLFVNSLMEISSLQNKRRWITETLREEVVSVFLYKEKMTLSVSESVIVGYML